MNEEIFMTEKELNESNTKQLIWFDKNGFNLDGTTFIIDYPDTYKIKDLLKQEGCKYSKDLNWHSPRKFKLEGIKDLSFLPIAFNDFFSWDYHFNKPLIYPDAVDRINILLSQSRNEDFIGEIKERIKNLEVTFKNYFSFQGYFGTTYVYKFKDSSGNNIRWKTAKELDLIAERLYSITGTVKSHEFYRGEKITYLTRCILEEE